MRGIHVVVFGAVAACGSVNEGLPDAPNGDGSTGDGALANPGDVVWVRSMSAAFGLGIAEGPGGLIFTGYISAPADFGGGVMTPRGANDLVIGDFKPEDASYIYQAHHNDVSGGQVYGDVRQTDPVGNPLVFGVSYGDVNLGLGLVTGGGGTGSDGFIGRYGSGTPSWVHRMVGPGEDKIVTTAPAPGGEVYAGGWFEQTTTWNSSQLTSEGFRDFFVARLNTFTGAVSTTTPFHGTGRDELSSIAGDGTNLIIGGFFDGTLAMGGSALPITATKTAAGAPTLDVFVAKLDAALTPLWVVRFGGSGTDRDTAVAMDAAGDVYVAGAFEGEVAFGAVNLMAAGMSDIFVAKLRGDTGGVAWAIRLGGAQLDSVSRIVVDRAGRPVIAGRIDSGDALIASLEATSGAVRWQKPIATVGPDYGWTLTLGATGDLYAVVNLGGAFDFGKPLIGPPAASSVILRIAP